MKTKVCRSCGLEKSVEEFHPRKGMNKAGEPYRVSKCKPCYRNYLNSRNYPLRERMRRWQADAREKPAHRGITILSSIKHRAKTKGLDFDLDIEFISEGIRNGCPKTGLPFHLEQVEGGRATKHPMAPSVDRIDSTKGYTKDNCQVVSTFYNLAKNGWDEEVILDLMSRVTDLHGAVKA